MAVGRVLLRRVGRLVNGQGAASAFLCLALAACLPGNDGKPGAKARLHSPPIVVAKPRTLLLALDGLPFRDVEKAIARGAFADWPKPVPLVSPFPSMTNVGFAALFEPFGVAPSEGYEIHHFDRIRNEIVGGNPFAYDSETMAWTGMLDASLKGLASKLSMYTSPRKTARRELSMIEDVLLSSQREIVIGYIGSTDGVVHLKGDENAVQYLRELDRDLEGLRWRHLEATGRPLRVVIFSDHGNGDVKVHGAKGFARLLRQAGLRVTDRLEQPHDVVAPTFGLVNYGALFLRPEDAETAARAIASHDSVDLVAWRSAQETIEVLSRSGSARVRWREAGARRRIAYDCAEGDPLRIAAARSRLAASGSLDLRGFADEDDWFRETGVGDFPDPLRRLVDALAGDRVLNPATVLFSLRPGRCWGWLSARAGSWLKGGRLKGTHGGLDRESSLGVFLTNDPELAPAAAVQASRALASLASDVVAERIESRQVARY